MNLTKILPTFAAVVVLSACAKDAPEMTKSSAQSAQMAEMQTLPTITDKTVVYSCNKQTVTAVYQFENQEPVAAMVSVGDGIIAKDFTRDKSQNDFTSFVSGDYVWNVDSGLTLDKFDSVVPVNLIQKGKSSDNIIVKNCDVNVKATKKANL
ncbi:TPA: hypothetical protein ACPP6V_001578 [Haemophilus influenzae]|uniref:hypothetical protein n=1 Tax=Haemophilus influenzae TaxID=727 RepID=UPI000DA2C713|nr:hypothetical protein [Haemophilus influenzae]SQG35937.1 excinuclease ABC subunit A [Haemophilus influenzae]